MDIHEETGNHTPFDIIRAHAFKLKSKLAVLFVFMIMSYQILANPLVLFLQQYAFIV